MDTKKTILEQIRPEDLALLEGKPLERRFGREEDNVEVHVFDMNDKYLISLKNFTEYEIPDVIDDIKGYYNEITFNPDNILRKLGLNSGQYKIKVNFQRKKIQNSFSRIFFIDEISPSRTEIRAKLNPNIDSTPLIKGIQELVVELQGADDEYFKDFALNFGENVILTGVNIETQSQPTLSLLIKLYEPIPNSINEKTKFRIIEELTNPIEYIVDLGAPEIEIETTELRGPNLRINTSLNSSMPSKYKSYNDVLRSGATSSLNNILNAVSQSAPISIDYTNTNTESGYTFEKFTHFGSAEEKLSNFNYKLGLIELYNSQSNYIDSINNSTSNPSLIIEKQNNIDLTNKIIQNFNGFEKFLYFESGNYSWPKSNSTKPYINFPTTSSEALTWLGSKTPTDSDYGGQLLSASQFDDQNLYILRNTIPQYIIDNTQNSEFLTFIDMVGQHFDDLWIYIENISDKNIADNALHRGISKDLVFNALKEKGIPAFDQFENTSLFEYILGEDGSGNFQFQPPTSQSMVSASDNGSIPKADITKEVWKRLYHNAPYLLKTKGTERGIKALIACYGIPETILHVKEYGGPMTDKSTFKTFSYEKATKALYFNNATQTSLNVITSPTVEDGKKHFEFTVVPNKINEVNPILSSSTAITSIISSSINPKAGYFSGSFGTSSKFPVYSGRPLTFFIDVNSSTELSITASTYLDNQIHNISFTSSYSGNNFNIGTYGDKNNFYTHNFKTYTSSLSQSIKDTHTKDPNIIAGNNTSSYFNDLIYYAPLGANLKTESLSDGYHFTDYSPQNNNTGRLTINGDLVRTSYDTIQYIHHLNTPDTVGVGMVSEKVRYDKGNIDDNMLSPFIKSEASSLDRQPLDYSTLGVFFSPTFEINEDIVYTLGGFRLDDYIGDPQHLSINNYPDLKGLRDTYGEKVDRRYNFFDYIKTIQHFDHTIFKIIEEFAPAKANLKTGLVIEPHYLQRDKFIYADTDFSNIELNEANYNGTGSLSGEYILNETSLNIIDTFDGSVGNIENNFLYGGYSNKYYRITSKYNHPTEDNAVADATAAGGTTPAFTDDSNRTSGAISNNFYQGPTTSAGSDSTSSGA
tara:strand:- start:61 stop:3339 length:3279 start_codon:yes stop_codon:yes gene_type:complete